jgi:hypothetical protein
MHFCVAAFIKQEKSLTLQPFGCKSNSFVSSSCHRFSLSLFIFRGHVPASIPTPAQRLSSRLMRTCALMAVMRPYRLMR